MNLSKLKLNGAKGKYYSTIEFDRPITQDAEGKGRTGTHSTKKGK